MANITIRNNAGDAILATVDTGTDTPQYIRVATSTATSAVLSVYPGDHTLTIHFDEGEFGGLASIPHATAPINPVRGAVIVAPSVGNVATFYLVPEFPAAARTGSLTISFYNVGDEPTKVRKTLTGGKTLSGNVHGGELSVTDPAFDVNFTESTTTGPATAPTYNYAYIAELGRYYFLSSPTMIGARGVRYTAHVDVLMTYADEIEALTPIVARQENEGDPMLVDPMATFDETTTFQVTDIGTMFEVSENETDATIVVQTLGGEQAQ